MPVQRVALTVLPQLAEFFAGQAAALLGYAEQVEQLSVALHTRGDIGAALGLLMERYSVDRHQAFAFLARNSQDQNVKVRAASRVLIGTFQRTPIQGRKSPRLSPALPPATRHSGHVGRAGGRLLRRLDLVSPLGSRVVS